MVGDDHRPDEARTSPCVASFIDERISQRQRAAFQRTVRAPYLPDCHRPLAPAALSKGTAQFVPGANSMPYIKVLVSGARRVESDAIYFLKKASEERTAAL